jgi:general secretion pathway protein E
MRLLDTGSRLYDMEELGLEGEEVDVFKRLVDASHGIVLVTGPTGSGKTTTLYSVLKYLSKPEVNIVTIEDPIEMVFEDFNQVAVRPQIEITFASALRTMLRQDPDIIMVGEVRDTETAENAVQAALTGHLVLSTLHTNDAPSSITRLLDLGIPHFLITSTLIGIMAQRLVREICTHCLEEYTPTHDEAALLRMDPVRLKDYKFKRGRGCLHCRQTGYSGRTGIYEVLPMSEKIRGLVTAGASSPELFKGAREEGMRTLREAAIEKVHQGITTVAEMIRVTSA